MNVELRVRGILFDMDGVLMSSIGSVERSWQRYAVSRNLDPERTIHVAHGRRAIETVRTLRPDLNDEEELRFIEDLEVEDNEGLVVLPGVPELLAALPEGSWAVVTSATERLARRRMACAGITIPRHFVTAETVAEGKPHPEPYLRGAALLGAKPGECLVIEDAPAGVASGKTAGCRVLAVLTTYGQEDLAAADWRVPTLAEVHATAERPDQILVQFEPRG
ncbi:MAG: HAD-IA family hydrolase [Acidobacteriaceae bacterium]